MLFALICGFCFLRAAGAVTVYGQIPFGQTSGLGASTTAAAPAQTQLPAYDETLLKAPPLPAERSPTEFTLNLQATNTSVPGLSIMQHGSFYGFSIEMSVITQLLGKNSTFVQVPFLNLMSNIQQRAGGIHIRLGGNTQDFAVYVDKLDNGHALGKEKVDSKNPTQTPSVMYTMDLFYLASNISSLVNVRWYLGIPFNDTNWRLQVAEYGQAILGDKLIGLQAGNEPDYYQPHGHRPDGYSPFDYFNEFGSLIKNIGENPRIPTKNMLIGPSLASGPWMPEQVWDTGYIQAYADSLCALTVEHYPTNNCFARFGVGSPVDPQETFGSFLNHNSGLNMVRPYRNSSALALAAGKPFIMFETNTATCGGLPGVSDSFGAALWAIDYGLTMAAANFSGALLHVGGQNVYYNPFTAPPTNQSTFNQWTVGAVYYSVLVVAEVFGTSNLSQIVDTTTNIYTPSYAIYDNSVLSRIALLNFNDDPTSGSDFMATISIQGGSVPAQVKVKYFEAESVAVKTNLTWGGQTFGNKFEVDGRPKGTLNVTTIDCDQAANICRVPVKAPSFALVFLTDSPATQEATPTVFTTSAYTKLINTATIDPSVLATSNGHSGKERSRLGSTSFGSVSSARTPYDNLPVTLIVMGAMLGAISVTNIL